MENSIRNTNGVFLIVNNIPVYIRSPDLRNFFSSFIETGAFVCFHYVHRPEAHKPLNESSDRQGIRRSRICCCVVKIYPDRADEFIQKYEGEHWLDKRGETLTSCCHVKKITLSQDSNVSYSGLSYKNGIIHSGLPFNQETLSSSIIESLLEMHPPSFMPNGNVGTKTSHYLDEINACRLPPSLIYKLGLPFPRSHRERIYGDRVYGNVPPKYKQNSRNIIRYKPQPAKLVLCESPTQKKLWCSRSKPEESNQEEIKEESEYEIEEEWNHRSHNDVSGQERNKEQLFGDKWETGGSDLVSYLDAQHCDVKLSDLDEKAANDGNVDTRIYEGAGVDCGKDMKDVESMKKNVQDGTETEVDSLYDFAAFEKYTTGFGRKILEAQGWKQGEGVGRNAAGIAEPIPNDGQRPSDKKGFGFHGEKLSRPPKWKRKHLRRNAEVSGDRVYISTVHDNPQESFAKQEFLKEHS